MSATRTIDTHTHILTLETAAMLSETAPKVPVSITPIDEDFADLAAGDTKYHMYPTGGFDVPRRLKDMAATGVDVQVLSVTPSTYFYQHDAAMAVVTSQIQNEQMAKLVAAHPTRFMGIATLPMQAPERAADELKRSMSKLGLRGAMFASNIVGKNLDDPSFEPLWATAEELGGFMFIHPYNVAGADRLKPYYLGNLIGNPLDTTIAAACLIFGGVMERHPKLNICLAHGGGFTPYQAPRWEHGWAVRPETKKYLKQQPRNIVGQFYYDTILHSDKTLEAMIGLTGIERVVLGSDYPYDMAMMDCVAHVRSLSISDADKAAILNGNAERLLAGKP